MRRKRFFHVAAVILCLAFCSGCACEHQFGEWKLATASTCSEKGTESRVCSVCQEEEVRELALDEANHSMSVWKTIEKKTCEKDGKRIRTCALCKYEETENLPAGHVWVAATCQHAKYCSDCHIISGTAGAHEIRVTSGSGRLSCNGCDLMVSLNISLPHPAAPTQDYVRVFVSNRTEETITFPSQIYHIGGYSCFKSSSVIVAPDDFESFKVSAGTLFSQEPMYLDKKDTMSIQIEIGAQTYYCDVDTDGVVKMRKDGSLSYYHR